MEFIESVSKEEYSEFVRNHKYSHFLKSYEWGEVSRLQGRIPFCVGLKKNGKLIATALLLKKKLPFGYSYFYIPRGYTIDYSDHDLIREFTLCIDKFTRKHKSLFFKIDPDIKLHTIDKDANIVDGENNYALVNMLKSIGFKRKKLNKFFENEQPRFTFRIKLDNEENVNKRYSKTAHRFIKKSNFFEVEPCIGKKEEVVDFVRLMKLTEKRQNFYSHNSNYYETFYEIFKENNNVDLMLAKINTKQIISKLEEEIKKTDDIEIKNKKIEEKKLFENREEVVVVSAYFTVFYGNKAWYLYGANDMEFKNTLANYKLFDFQIKEALKRKIELFDEFGTIGDVHTDSKLIGLHEFKKKFGGEYTEFIGEFDYVQKPFLSLLYKIVIPIRRKIVRRRLRSKEK